MLATLPLLTDTDFPPIRRSQLTTLQANLGYRCNQSCLHCHVAAGPNRTETMTWNTMELLLDFAAHHSISTLDLTGGAPELNPDFCRLVIDARNQGLQVIDRCNLTILSEPGQENLAEFLAAHQIQITASLPCYLEENVDRQRGKGVFHASIEGLRRLNALGYGSHPDLPLNLVFNPQGAELPASQVTLEADYHRYLNEQYGIVFSSLLVLANMPIKRFGSTLVSKGQFHPYMKLLRDAHLDANLDAVMCRNLISVDWQGYVYDCDFNQMLGLPLGASLQPIHLSKIRDFEFERQSIRVADHCYGCTAGQGSGCSGALRTPQSKPV